MEIKHINSEPKGSFRVEDGNITAGKLTYSWAGKDKFIIDHIEVKPEYRGQDLGKLLVSNAVRFARESGTKIIPLCPYAKKIFDHTPDIQDVQF